MVGKNCSSLSTRVLLTLLLLVLGSCVTSPGRNAAVTSQIQSSSWLLNSLDNHTGSGTAAHNALDLIETRLRSAGIQHIVRAASSTAGSGSSVTAASALYVLDGTVLRWQTDAVMERFPSVEIALTLTNRLSGQQVWTGKFRHTGKVSSTLTGAADEVASVLVARMLHTLATQHSSSVQVAHANVSDTAAVDESAVSLRSPASMVPVSTAVRRIDSGQPDARLSSRDLERNSIAVFYGTDLPVTILGQFDRVVVEPDNVPPQQLQALLETGTTPYAYLSVGEVGPTRDFADALESSWSLGVNSDWDSRVMDLSAPGWQQFLAARIDSLVAAGYQGLFLDTLDSYQLFATDNLAREQQQEALVRIISNAKTRHPNLRLIANRGFEVLDSIATQLEAIAAESLYQGWDNAAGRYREVAQNDREWLLAKLQHAVENYGLDAIVIDYLPPERRAEALATAAAIADLGFTPWVGTPALDSVGVGSLEVIPRDVLLVYDSRQSGAIEDSEVHRLLATPLEYFGYVPVYLDIAVETLPSAPLTGRIAGVASWFDRPVNHPGYQGWITRQMREGISVAMLGHAGISFDTELSALTGLSPAFGFDAKTATITTRDRLIGFERDPVPRVSLADGRLVSRGGDNQIHLGYTDADDRKLDTVVTGPWGGLAINPSVIDIDPSGINFWIIDPFEFLRTALGLQTVPMPDVTTLNGNRLWFAHIDGDALPSWAEMPGKKLGAEVIYSELLQRHRYPHSVSIVEAEMTSMPQVADRWPRMLTLMRKMFNEPYIEAASHTFSHPFKWGLIGAEPTSGKYNLAVGNYQFSAERELLGSLSFINEKLLPADSSTNLVFWSGDALPTAETLAVVSDNNLINLNGGNTVISSAVPSASAVSPMARIVDGHVQAYAPIMNENVYTNDWTGPFDGFRDVIDTLKMTDRPRRLKPQNIYYHFYSGTKIAAMKAMHEVYDWSLAQEINPVYASEYARLVPAWRKAGVARYLDGTWKLSFLGPLRSIRILDQQYWPQLNTADQLAGARRLHDGVYVHTDGSDTVEFKLGTPEPQGPYLVASNGQVQYWKKNRWRCSVSNS
ncbi:MAG: bifunctional glycoside hydrolase 114/ polysaccharide deacetylase family protein [Gammaproteobacteria bacterium]|nr:bifunctional glycoside hydrolase 114/ polysaccharide deacetylase family protein [Gammaproteobacteria bacterium]